MVAAWVRVWSFKPSQFSTIVFLLKRLQKPKNLQNLSYSREDIIKLDNNLGKNYQSFRSIGYSFSIKWVFVTSSILFHSIQFEHLSEHSYQLSYRHPFQNSCTLLLFSSVPKRRTVPNKHTGVKVLIKRMCSPQLANRPDFFLFGGNHQR